MAEIQKVILEYEVNDEALRASRELLLDTARAAGVSEEQIKDINSRLNEQVTATRRARQEQARQQQTVRSLTTEARRLETALDGATDTRKQEQLQSELRDTERALERVGREARETGNELDRAGTRGRSAFSGIGGLVGGFLGGFIGGGVADLFQSAIRGATDFVKEGIALNNIQQEAEQKLLTLLGGRVEIQQKLIQQAGELQQVTQFGDEETIEGLNKVLELTQGNVEAAEKLIPVIQDLAVGQFQGNLIPAADVVAKTFASSTNQLSRYGIQIEGAAGSSERLESVISELTERFGGLARTVAEAGTGPITQLQNAYGDLQEVVGERLTGSLNAAATGARGLVEQLTEILKVPVEDKVRDEQQELNRLATALINTSEEEEARGRIIDELNRKFPGFLANLSEEERTNENIRKRLDDVNAAYIQRLAAIAVTKDLEAAEKDYSESVRTANRNNQLLAATLRDVQNAFPQFEDVITNDSLTSLERAQSVINRARIAGEDFNETVSTGVGGFALQENALGRLERQLRNYNNETDSAAESQDLITRLQREQSEILATITEDFGLLTGSIKETGEETEKAANTIQLMKARLESLRNELETTDTGSERFKELRAEIIQLEKDIERLTAKPKEVKVDTKEIERARREAEKLAEDVEKLRFQIQLEAAGGDETFEGLNLLQERAIGEVKVTAAFQELTESEKTLLIEQITAGFEDRRVRLRASIDDTNLSADLERVAQNLAIDNLDSTQQLEIDLNAAQAIEDAEDRNTAIEAANDAFRERERQATITFLQQLIDLRAAAGLDTTDQEQQLLEQRIQAVQEAADRELEIAQNKANEELEIERNKQALLQEVLTTAEDARAAGFELIAAAQEAAFKRELEAAGENAQERAEIEEEFARRKKALLLAEAISASSLAVIQVFASSAPFALKLVQAAIVAARLAAEVTTIRNQDFGFKDGVFSLGNKDSKVRIPGRGTRTSDSIPANLSRGETVFSASMTDQNYTPFNRLSNGEYMRPYVAPDGRIVYSFDGQPEFAEPRVQPEALAAITPPPVSVIAPDVINTVGQSQQIIVQAPGTDLKHLEKGIAKELNAMIQKEAFEKGTFWNHVLNKVRK